MSAYAWCVGHEQRISRGVKVDITFGTILKPTCEKNLCEVQQIRTRQPDLLCYSCVSAAAGGPAVTRNN